MSIVCRDQFLGLPDCGEEAADAVVLPLPFERTVSYGRGTSGGPRAILEASCQLETFDDETLVDFCESPRVHTTAPHPDDGNVERYLRSVQNRVARLKGKFVLSLGGEHTVTYGLATGLVADARRLTVVQIDAHADMIDELDGLRWSHGTCMRRLWEEGCTILQIGVRSLSRSEHDFLAGQDRVVCHHAHRLATEWPEVIARLCHIEGEVYLTVDVDGLDPSIIPSTGTPQPGGLTWGQTMEVFRAVFAAPRCRLIGADLVEFVPSPNPPGCDIVAAKLVAKMLAFWWIGRRS